MAKRKRDRVRLNREDLLRQPALWWGDEAGFHTTRCPHARTQMIAGTFAEASSKVMRPCLVCWVQVANTSTVLRAWTDLVREAFVQVVLKHLNLEGVQ